MLSVDRKWVLQVISGKPRGTDRRLAQRWESVRESRVRDEQVIGLLDQKPMSLSVHPRKDEIEADAPVPHKT